MSQYLVREALEPIARRRVNAAKRQADARRKMGQLSVLIDADVLAAWKLYVKDRCEQDEEWSLRLLVEELLERELRRKKRW